MSLKAKLYDGNYHCRYCDKSFRIAEQAEWLVHQQQCNKKFTNRFKRLFHITGG
jgi:hypothetical protein